MYKLKIEKITKLNIILYNNFKKYKQLSISPLYFFKYVLNFQHFVKHPMVYLLHLIQLNQKLITIKLILFIMLLIFFHFMTG